MEIRRSLKPVPSRAIALILAALAVLALALTAGYTLAPRPHGGPPTLGPAAAAEQINHNRSEEGLGGATSVGGEQVAHNRSEEGLK